MTSEQVTDVPSETKKFVFSTKLNEKPTQSFQSLNKRIEISIPEVNSATFYRNF